MPDDSCRDGAEWMHAGYLRGQSALMRQLRQLLSGISGLEAPVLLQGEAGTGKEAVARSIHSNSNRAGAPFVTATQWRRHDSVLFGVHHPDKPEWRLPGLVSEADGGTLFVTDLHNLEPPSQAKLLQVILQHQPFKRQFGKELFQVNVRLMVANRGEVWGWICADPFHADSYFHQNVVLVEVPPLRARAQDIPDLARYFLQRYMHKVGRRVRAISGAALDCLCAYRWPGNVRELRTVMQRAVVTDSSGVILPDDLPSIIVDAFAARRRHDSFHSFHTVLLDD